MRSLYICIFLFFGCLQTCLCADNSTSSSTTSTTTTTSSLVAATDGTSSQSSPVATSTGTPEANSAKPAAGSAPAPASASSPQTTPAAGSPPHASYPGFGKCTPTIPTVCVFGCSASSCSAKPTYQSPVSTASVSPNSSSSFTGVASAPLTSLHGVGSLLVLAALAVAGGMVAL